MKRSPKKDFEPGHGYSREDWDDVSDNPEVTPERLRQARPFAELFPDLAALSPAAISEPTGPAPLIEVTLHLEPKVIEKFRAAGVDWETRVNEALKRAKI